MCKGVTNGFAGEKFSTSPRIQGLDRQRVNSDENKIITPVKSFHEWNEWNGILSRLDFTPIGFEDPVWCKKSKWIITKAEITNGSKKCKAKNRVKVAFPTANPPHTHWTIIVPRYGTADKRLVITVAPQNDICPHGSTYPTKAVPIVTNISVTPTVQVWLKK